MEIILFTGSNEFVDGMRWSMKDSEIVVVSYKVPVKLSLSILESVRYLHACSASEIKSIIRKNLNSESRCLSFGFGYIFEQEDIDHFRHPILNFHTGRIPDNRGRTPLFWDIVEEKEFAYGTLHKINKEIDKGYVLEEVCVRVCNDDTPRTLASKLLRESLSKQIFVRWLLCSTGEIRTSGKEVTEEGRYKVAFSPDHIFVASEVSSKYLLLCWRCYCIWGEINIDGIKYKSIHEEYRDGDRPIRCADGLKLFGRIR